MLIKTHYKTNANGSGQIVAKGDGKQRTVTFDPSKSFDWNHGNAAGTLALALDLPWSEKILHDAIDNGLHHFLWGTDALIEAARANIL